MNNQPIETSHTLIYTEKYGNNKKQRKKSANNKCQTFASQLKMCEFYVNWRLRALSQPADSIL